MESLIPVYMLRDSVGENNPEAVSYTAHWKTTSYKKEQQHKKVLTQREDVAVQMFKVIFRVCSVTLLLTYLPILRDKLTHS